ncbi:MAG TPA: ribosome-associated translation inhibitor RaiA [Fibrobacteria bacterium]|nr:ribosome-associated translation inhibitor RaiA [Fibrobacteria bacterium]
MQVKVTGRHFDASTELQSNVEAQIAALAKFNDRITGAHVILDKQPNELRSAHAELSVAGHGVVSVSAEAETMHKAVDEMFLKIERVLKKENEKAKDHRAPSMDKVVEA